MSSMDQPPSWTEYPSVRGLRYNGKDIDPNAQTERRGDAGPVSVLLRGWDSPAAFFTTKRHSWAFSRFLADRYFSLSERNSSSALEPRDIPHPSMPLRDVRMLTSHHWSSTHHGCPTASRVGGSHVLDAPRRSTTVLAAKKASKPGSSGRRGS